MRFMQTESVLQTKNRSGPTKNRFSVALADMGKKWLDFGELDLIFKVTPAL